MAAIIRNIEPGDNESLASIVRCVLKEFNADKPGTAYFESSTDNIHGVFQKPRSKYFVAELNGKVVGGGGIYATDGLPEGYCELVKLYLLKEARGTGLGRSVLEKCFTWAKGKGYTHVYLESMTELMDAVGLYTKLGFTHIDHPLGKCGHAVCGIWMTKEL